MMKTNLFFHHFFVILIYVKGYDYMVKNIKEKKDTLKAIPKKNYIIVIAIFAITIILVFFLRSWYISYQDYAKTIPVLKGVISEIRYNEVHNYINDNQTAILYMGVADDEDCRNLEVDLKKIIQKRHLKDKIVYFNITDVQDKDLLLKEINDKYIVNDKIYSYPAIMLFEDGKIVDFKSRNASNNLLISDVEQILDEYEIHGD